MRPIAHLAIGALLTSCYHPTSLEGAGDTAAEPEAEVDVSGESGVDPEPDPPEDPVPEALDAVDVAPGDAAGEEGDELPDLGELPVTYAPDFALEDLNPDSPTYGSVRRVSDERGKVLVIYFGSFS
jgi:hypothetical protein